MRLPIAPRHIAPRLATGAFILNSGLSKRGADEQSAAGYHGMAKEPYPFLDKVEPLTFAQALSTGEIALGTALLLPIVPTSVAGAGLTAFSGALVGMYLRTPWMHQEGDVRPSPDGIPFAKDVWLLGIGLGFVIDALTHK